MLNPTLLPLDKLHDLVLSNSDVDDAEMVVELGGFGGLGYHAVRLLSLSCP